MLFFKHSYLFYIFSYHIDVFLQNFSPYPSKILSTFRFGYIQNFGKNKVIPLRCR